MTILEEIFEHKRSELVRSKAEKPLAQVESEADRAEPPLDFTAALSQRSHPALIAEIKQRSPSRGLLSAAFDPLTLAQVYRDNGAAALSILTDQRYFGGSLEILQQVAAHFQQTVGRRLPLLRKDFICDPYQVFEARASGADAILLIAASLEERLLRELQGLAQALGMTALVEVHNQAELQTALKVQPRLIGINNRDLHTFNVDLQTYQELRPSIPQGILVTAESGIHSLKDVQKLEKAGVDAILVGEALVTAEDVAAKVRSLAQAEVPL